MINTHSNNSEAMALRNLVVAYVTYSPLEGKPVRALEAVQLYSRWMNAARYCDAAAFAEMRAARMLVNRVHASFGWAQLSRKSAL